MSGGISASTLALAGAAAVGGAVLASSMTSKGGAPSPQEVVAPPLAQSAKAPSVSVARRQNQTVEGGPGGAGGGTLLTGPGGVDSSLLNLGKSTLLGQ